MYSSFAERDGKEANGEAEKRRARADAKQLSQAKSETRTDQKEERSKHAQESRAYKLSPSRRACVQESPAVESFWSQR